MRCPKELTLRDFFLERLDQDQSDRVSLHLEECTACRSVAESITNDDVAVDCLSSYRRQRANEFDNATFVSSQGDDSTFAARGETSADSHRWSDETEGSTRISDSFGRFRIRRVLGRGGFGIVYLADDTVLDRPTALKLATTSTLLDPKLRHRFLQEAQIAARLHHPNIVPVFEAGEIEGQCFLASEYIQGPTLAQWMDAHGSMAAHAAADVTMELANAVQHAHERGILHRDVKPGNILLDEREKSLVDAEATSQSTTNRLTTSIEFIPKLTDFGLAKSLDGGVMSATATGIMMGTPPYMAPEQASGRKEELGPHTDVYALGAVLYELLTGRLPIEGNDNADTLRRVLTEFPTAPRKIAPSTPSDLEAICLKCLEKEPARRYTTAADLAEDLQRFLRGESTRAKPLSPSAQLARWCRRRPATAALVGTIVLATVTVIALLTFHSSRLSLLTENLQTALDASEKSEQRAEASDLQARQQLYCSDITLAHQAVQTGDFRRASSLLRRHIPDQFQHDVRGVEWEFLWRSADFSGDLIAQGPHAVRSVAYSRDGRFVVSAGEEDTVRLYALPEKRLEIAIPTGHRVVHAALFSPDDSLLITAGDDGVIRMWRPRTGKLVRSIQAHEGMIHALAMSMDGRTLVSAGEDTHICLRNVNTGEPMGKLTGHTRHVSDVAISPDARLVVSVSHDKTVRLWSLDTMSQIASFDGHAKRATSAEFSPDGRRLVTGSVDGTTRLWDVESQQCLEGISHLDAVDKVMFEPDGSWYASGDRSGTVRLCPVDEIVSRQSWDSILTLEGPILWCRYYDDNRLMMLAGSELLFFDRTSGKQHRFELSERSVLQRFEQTDRRNDLIQLSPAGDTLVCVNQVYKIDPSTTNVWQYAFTLNVDKDHVRAVTISPDGRRLAIGLTTGRLQIHDPTDGRLLKVLPAERVGHNDTLTLSFLSNETLWSVDVHARFIDQWNLSTGQKSTELLDNVAAVRSARLFPGVNLLAEFGQDAIIGLWNTTDWLSRGKLAGHGGIPADVPYAIKAIDLSPDGSLLVSAGNDFSVRLWNVEKRRCAQLLRTSANSATFSPDGSELMTVNEGGTIKFWSTASLAGRNVREVKEFVSHTGRVYGLSFDATGQNLVTSSTDGKLVRWELEHSKPTWKPLGEDTVFDIEFAADVKELVIADSAGVHVYDEMTGQCLKRLADDEEQWKSVATSPDLSRVALATEHGAIRVMDRDACVIANWEVATRIGGSALDMSTDGRHLLVRQFHENRFLLFDTHNRDQTRSYKAEHAECAVFAREGNLFAHTSANDIVVLDLDTDEEIRLRGHENTVMCLAFSADDRLLASGGNDRQVVVWDIARHAPLHRFIAHRDDVEAVAFSRDGKTLFTGGRDGSIKLWNLTTGQELFELARLGRPIDGLRVSPDGNWLVCLPSHGHARMLDLRATNSVPSFRSRANAVEAAVGSPSESLSTSEVDLEGEPSDNRFRPVSLRDVANVTTTDMVFESGHTIIFPTWSTKRFCDVPFELIDPQGKQKANAIVLRGSHGQTRNLLKTVKLPCNVAARAVHLLSGVSGWGHPIAVKGTTAMIVRLHYADGEVENHPLKEGIHFADYVRPIDVPTSKLAFMPCGRQLRYLAIHPKRNEQINTIQLVKGRANSAPLVMAVTIEVADDARD